MPKPPKDVTDAELAVLRELWARSPGTIRELTARLYPGGGTSHYATVQKLLERLEEKGCVSRDASEVPHRFAPRVAQSDLVGRRLTELADKLCGGSLAPLLTHLVRSHSLTRAEVGELRDLIDRLDRGRSDKKKG